MSKIVRPKRRSSAISHTLSPLARMPHNQRQSIANTMDKEALCDVTFIAGPDQIEFRANRFLFAAISDVFQAMLYGSMAESRPDSTVLIPDIDADAFGVVRDFAYCKIPKINIKNVVAISQIAQKYQISTLSPVCNHHFASYLDEQSICTMINDAVNAHLSVLISSCTNAIKERLGYHAENIIKSDGFLKMGVPAMSLFLQIDELRIKEEDLWRALLKWSGHRADSEKEKSVIPFPENSNSSPKRRKLNDGSRDTNNNENHPSDMSALKAICPFIRFGLMSGEYFVRRVKPTGCLSDKEMLEISSYILCNGNSVQCPPFSVKKRVFDRFIAIQRGEIKVPLGHRGYLQISKNRSCDPTSTVTLEVNREAKLTGIGMINVQGVLGAVTIGIAMREVDPDGFTIALQELSFSTTGKSYPIPVYFERPISLRGDRRYSLTVVIKRTDSNMVKAELHSLFARRTSSDLTVTFHSTKKRKPSNTTITTSAFKGVAFISTLYFLRA